MTNPLWKHATVWAIALAITALMIVVRDRFGLPWWPVIWGGIVYGVLALVLLVPLLVNRLRKW